MSRPLLLDLFCGAGGAAMGYHNAGFDVIGFDIKPQPHYPFPFIEADALDVWRHKALLGRTDAIHASPPCQAYSKLRSLQPTGTHPDLLPQTRRLLEASGLPWVIENVPGSPMHHRPSLMGYGGIELCGSMFGLGVGDRQLRRHRWFESSLPLWQLYCCHNSKAIGVYGHGGHAGRHHMALAGEAREAMGIDWMTRAEMTQAIPPAYTEFIGAQLLEHLERVA